MGSAENEQNKSSDVLTCPHGAGRVHGCFDVLAFERSLCLANEAMSPVSPNHSLSMRFPVQHPLRTRELRGARTLTSCPDEKAGARSKGTCGHAASSLALHRAPSVTSGLSLARAAGRSRGNPVHFVVEWKAAASILPSAPSRVQGGKCGTSCSSLYLVRGSDPGPAHRTAAGAGSGPRASAAPVRMSHFKKWAAPEPCQLSSRWSFSARLVC